MNGTTLDLRFSQMHICAFKMDYIEIAGDDQPNTQPHHSGRYRGWAFGHCSWWRWAIVKLIPWANPEEEELPEAGSDNLGLVTKEDMDLRCRKIGVGDKTLTSLSSMKNGSKNQSVFLFPSVSFHSWQTVQMGAIMNNKNAFMNITMCCWGFYCFSCRKWSTYS